jgi:hypothetical protein
MGNSGWIFNDGNVIAVKFRAIERLGGEPFTLKNSATWVKKGLAFLYPDPGGGK